MNEIIKYRGYSIEHMGRSHWNVYPPCDIFPVDSFNSLQAAKRAVDKILKEV